MEKTFDGFKDNILNENKNMLNYKAWLLDVINNMVGLVKTKNTKEKYVGYLNLLDDTYTNIDKKLLTKISNDFSGLCAKYYDLHDEMLSYTHTFKHGDSEVRTIKKSRLELKELIIKRGYDSEYGIPTTDTYYPCSRFLLLISVYSINDSTRILHKFESFKSIMNESEIKWFNTYFPNLDMWSSLYYELEVVRNMLNPPTSEKNKSKLELLLSNGKLNVKLQYAVNKIAEDFRIVIENTEYKYYTDIVNLVKTKYPDGITFDKFSKINRNTDLLFIMAKKQADTDIYKLLPNYDDNLRQKAIDVSNDHIIPFKMKMYGKLSGFINDINKEFEVSVYGRNKSRNEIYFNFKDGSSFSIKNSVVSKFSNRGTFFYTYPTTFHSAYLPNREKISNPNEYNVKKAFNDYETH